MSSDIDQPINDPAREIADLEDRLDAVTGMLARVESANQEMIPFRVVQRLSDGEAPLRVWREHRQLTIAQLAERAGVSTQIINEIEDGRLDGPLRVFVALARELGIDAEDLLPWPQEDCPPP